MKAIIISHERGGYYVLDRKGDFRFVRGFTSKAVGTEIDVRTGSFGYSYQMAAIAACLVFSLVFGGFGMMWNSESYSVFMDINPSIELVFNGFDRLKTARGMNDDGTELLAGLALKGRAGDVIVALIQEAQRQGYIHTESGLAGISIAVIAKNGKAPDRYTTAIYAALEKYQMQNMVNFLQTEEGSFALREKAAELGVSPGKLLLVEQYFSLYQTTALDLEWEDIVKMPVGELLVKIHEAEEKAEAADDDLSAGEGNSGNGSLGDRSEANQAGGGNGAANGASGDTDQNDPALTHPGAAPDEAGTGEDEAAEPVAQGSGAGAGAGGTDEPGGHSGASTGSGEDAGGSYGVNSANPNAGSGNNSGNTTTNPNAGPGNNSGNTTTNPNAGPGNNSGNTTTNPNAGPGNNSGNTTTNPNAGPGNNSGNDTTNPNAGPGNNSGNDTTNPNAGPGNNSGNDTTNPNAGPGNNSGNNSGSEPTDTGTDTGNDSGSKTDNPNKGSGNNSGNDSGSKTDNPNKGSGNNSGNDSGSKTDNPNKGSGNNSGNSTAEP